MPPTPEDSVELDEAERRYAKITDDAVASLRRLIGVPITDTVEPWCYEATRDNIRHYAHGIGDDNPLWCDPVVRRPGPRTARSSLRPASCSPSTASCRVTSAACPGSTPCGPAPTSPGMSPIRRGTEIRTQAYLKDLVEHQTRFAGRALQQIYHVDFSDERGTLLCSGDSWCFRTERDTARELGTKYDEAKRRAPRRYDEEDLRAIFDLYEAEPVRGAEPRYLDDVAVGDELPPMAKGPMTVTGFIAFAQGWGGLYIRANKLAWKQLRKHPGLGIPNAAGIPDVPERVHWEDDLATRRRHARRLRLRARAVLVAHPPPHQLDGRRRLPCATIAARSATTTWSVTGSASRVGLWPSAPTTTASGA